MATRKSRVSRRGRKTRRTMNKRTQQRGKRSGVSKSNKRMNRRRTMNNKRRRTMNNKRMNQRRTNRNNKRRRTMNKRRKVIDGGSKRSEMNKIFQEAFSNIQKSDYGDKIISQSESPGFENLLMDFPGEKFPASPAPGGITQEQMMDKSKVKGFLPGWYERQGAPEILDIGFFLQGNGPPFMGLLETPWFFFSFNPMNVFDFGHEPREVSRDVIDLYQEDISERMKVAANDHFLEETPNYEEMNEIHRDVWTVTNSDVYLPVLFYVVANCFQKFHQHRRYPRYDRGAFKQETSNILKELQSLGIFSQLLKSEGEKWIIPLTQPPPLVVAEELNELKEELKKCRDDSHAFLDESAHRMVNTALEQTRGFEGDWQARQGHEHQHVQDRLAARALRRPPPTPGGPSEAAEPLPPPPTPGGPSEAAQPLPPPPTARRATPPNIPKTMERLPTTVREGQVTTPSPFSRMENDALRRRLLSSSAASAPDDDPDDFGRLPPLTPGASAAADATPRAEPPKIGAPQSTPSPRPRRPK